jgi:hypothetical protein
MLVRLIARHRTREGAPFEPGISRSATGRRTSFGLPSRSLELGGGPSARPLAVYAAKGHDAQNRPRARVAPLTVGLVDAFLRRPGGGRGPTVSSPQPPRVERSHETHVSTAQSPPHPHPRFPCAHGNHGWPQGPREPPPQGPRASRRHQLQEVSLRVRRAVQTASRH